MRRMKILLEILKYSLMKRIIKDLKFETKPIHKQIYPATYNFRDEYHE